MALLQRPAVCFRAGREQEPPSFTEARASGDGAAEAPCAEGGGAAQTTVQPRRRCSPDDGAAQMDGEGQVMM